MVYSGYVELKFRNKDKKTGKYEKWENIAPLKIYVNFEDYEELKIKALRLATEQAKKYEQVRYEIDGTGQGHYIKLGLVLA
ncbi:hypothetical protein [Methanococcus voltae]|uniref:Uncharacterized protein n=1 Tax=Methanococcus voltae (strain ATCC BAA-1334 / A3) TaxID=456320 RepID=D7DS74_METV3|nr:hypothetical protein [Methanococcus voltae]MCS3901510.1 hypothetical protein [Methanococcus voltae]